MQVNTETKTYSFTLAEVKALIKWSSPDEDSEDEGSKGGNWMNYIHFDVKRSRVWATDGHRAVVATTDPDARPGQCRGPRVRSNAKLSSLSRAELKKALKGHRAKSTRVEIALGKNTASIVVTRPDGRFGYETLSEAEVALETTTDSRAVDIDQIFPIHGEDVPGLVGLQTGYLGALGDLDFCLTLKVRVHGELDPATFHGESRGSSLDGYESYWDAIIMPMRI